MKCVTNVQYLATCIKNKFALINHTHSTSDFNSGTLSAARGGLGKTTGFSWTQIGSFTYTGSCTINLSSYNEVLICALFDGKVLSSTVTKAILSTSSLEMWLSGGKSDTNNPVSGNARGVVNITSTRVTPVSVTFQATEYKNSSAFYVYAR